MFNFAKKKKSTDGEKINFDVDIPKSAAVAVCGEPSKNMPVSPIKHTAKFLKKENNIITLAIWLEKDYAPEYGENDVIDIAFNSYFDKSENFSLPKAARFSANILKIRAASEINNFVSGKINGIDSAGYDLYIAELQSVSNIRERPLREFYMTDISFSVCCKADLFDESGDANDSHKGYIKFDTVNMNSDGFSFKTARYIEQEKIFECMVLTKYEALPVTVKILKSQRAEEEKNKDGAKELKDIYIMRAIFVEADDAVRDMLAKRVFEYRQKMLILRENLINLKNFYDKIKKK